MSLFHSYTSTSAASSFLWLSPMSSPSIVLATSSIIACTWAFQQQGWSFCIPGVVLGARKLAGLRWKDVAALTRQYGAVVKDGARCLVRLTILLVTRQSDIANIFRYVR